MHADLLVPLACILAFISDVTNGSTVVKRSDAATRDLSSQERLNILEAHNDIRRKVSPTAADMFEITWDDELAKIATDYTRKCIYGHNSQRSDASAEFQYVGENLYISYGMPLDANFGANAVRSWGSEKQYYTYDATEPCEYDKVCGHYTQIVWAKTYKIGCGMTTCPEVEVNGKTWASATIFACNYGPGGNYRGEKPYSKGRPCDECRYNCADSLCEHQVEDEWDRPPWWPPWW